MCNLEELSQEQIATIALSFTAVCLTCISLGIEIGKCLQKRQQD